MLRSAPARVNDSLPDDMKVLKPTGHSGRASFVSGAINAGISAEVVSKVSKHKDPKSLKRYHHPDTMSLLSPALAINQTSNKIKKTFKRTEKMTKKIIVIYYLF